MVGRLWPIAVGRVHAAGLYYLFLTGARHEPHRHHRRQRYQPDLAQASRRQARRLRIAAFSVTHACSHFPHPVQAVLFTIGIK